MDRNNALSWELERPLVPIGSLNTGHKIQKAKTTNFCVAALSLVNTMIGGGILVLPKAAQDMGLFLMFGMLVVIALLNSYASSLLIAAAQIAGKFSYSDVGFFAMGRSAIFLYNATLLLCYGLLTTVYGEIFANAFENILTEGFGVAPLTVPHLSWFRVGILILFVMEFFLVIPKQLMEIKAASVLSFTSVLTFTSFLLYLLLSGRSQYDPQDVEKYLSRPLSNQMIAGVATVVTAYGFQPLVFPMYLGMSGRTPSRANYAFILACVLVTSVYAVVCVLGLLSFPNSNLQGDFLLTLSSQIGGWQATLLNMLYSFKMAMHIPMIFFAAKESALIMFDECARRTTSQPPSTGYQELEGRYAEVLPYVSMNSWAYYIITILLWTGTLAIAFIQIPIEQVSSVFDHQIVNYMGACGLNLIAFIYPPLFYLLAVRNSGNLAKNRTVSGAAFLLIFGILAMILTLYANIAQS